MRNYGDTGSYDPEWLGMNARMSEFNAALALTGLADIDERVRRRNQIAQMYTDQLCFLPGLRFQSVHPTDVNTYKDYSIHVTPSQFGMTRDELAEGLLAENIETKKYFYPPMHMQTLYKSFHDAATQRPQNHRRSHRWNSQLAYLRITAGLDHRNRFARDSPLG